MSPSGQALCTSITNTNSVSIHIRRGDYVQNHRVLRENGICSLSYYKRAVAELEKTQKDIFYFIFSDDINWVKKNISLGRDTVFVSDTTLTDSEELVIMSKCKHNIIANSSFSWWAAWINQNPNKICVAPKPWFNTAKYDSNLIPKSWIQLPK
jgi:hypothetical protein